MIDVQRQIVAQLYRELSQRGINSGSAGNVSLRTSDGMLITPSGCSAETLSEGSVVAMSLDGHVPHGGTPSSEWSMHAAIYQAFPQAGAVVHAHADSCTALACLNEPLPGFHYMVTRFGGDDVRCAPYVTFGTPELARAAVAALEGRTACLLSNHGMVVHGRDADEALQDAVLLESLCRQYLMARAAGAVRLLNATEIAASIERFKTYGSAAPHDHRGPPPAR